MKSFKDFLQEYKDKEENKLVCGLKDMERILEELQPVVDEYYEIQRKYNIKKSAFDKIKKGERLSNAKRECSFVDCTYPDMGCEAENGSATFSSKHQAETLINALRDNSNYYYAYLLEWQGVGKYKVVPQWKYDHDNEIVYTARFIKE